MRSTSKFLLSGGLLTAFALGACEPAADRADEFSMDTTRMDTSAPAAAPMPMESRSFQSDAQITTFLTTANAYEIESAEMALSRAASEQVRAFAETLQNDHEAMRANLAEVQQPGDTAAQDELGESDDLVSFNRDAVEELTDADSSEFDREWLEYQIELHERSLQGIEDALNANPGTELRTVLMDAQTAMQGHLQQARQLREQVENTGTT